MAGDGAEDDALTTRLTRRADFALAVLAGIATIGFAWSGYQSASWIRERFENSDLATIVNVEAATVATEADRTFGRDTLLYAQWITALQQGDQDAADVLFNLFTPDLQAFITESGVDDDGTPAENPLSNPQYDASRPETQALELEAKARELQRNAREASSNAARYSGIGVTFTAVLAAAGIALRFDRLRLQRVFVAICAVITLAAVVLTLLSPVKFG